MRPRTAHLRLAARSARNRGRGSVSFSRCCQSVCMWQGGGHEGADSSALTSTRDIRRDGSEPVANVSRVSFELVRPHSPEPALPREASRGGMMAGSAPRGSPCVPSTCHYGHRDMRQCLPGLAATLPLHYSNCLCHRVRPPTGDTCSRHPDASCSRSTGLRRRL